MNAARKIAISPLEYLERERATEHRSEYLQGEVFAMSGASLRHARIARRLQRALEDALDERCEVQGPDLRVKAEQTGLYTYPDLVVFCGEPQLEDDEFDTLLNPVAIVEVLSPSTESYDRGKKFKHYQTIESLEHYVLVAQDEPSIECFTRAGENWLLATASDLKQSLMLPKLRCSIPLAIVYRGIEFGDAVASPHA